MYFCIPTGTDAPIYYWPIATVGLIVVNSLAFFLTGNVEPFINQFGIINPLQWLTSLFMHADFSHLLGNMIFLWTFGIIVEGKIGWWKFLLIYLAIGIIESAIGQLMMLGSAGGSLGASAAIYGLLAVCVVWAPENNLQLTYGGVFFFRPFWGSCEISLLIIGFLYIAGDFFWTAMTHLQMSSYLCHFMGAVIGSTVGVAMLKMRRVDCEGFDLLSRMNGTFGEKPLPTLAQEKALKTQRDELNKELVAEKEKLNLYIDQGHYEMAYVKLRQLKKKDPKSNLSTELHWQLIGGLLKKKKFEISLSQMEDFMDQNPQHKNTVLLNMAKVYTHHLNQPRNTISTLGRIDASTLTAKQKSSALRIQEHAFEEIKSGSLDVNSLEFKD